MYQAEFMQRALEISRQALDNPGTAPFGSVITKDGRIVGEGLNHAEGRFDPTSHGEVEALRDACQRLQTLDLTGCELYTSCEPCPLCVAAMALAGISKLYYAASLEDSSRALSSLRRENRHSIEISTLRAEAGSDIADRKMEVQQAMASEAVDILVQYGQKITDKITERS